MANLINADPTNGLKLISDSSSEIQLQANGVTVATVNSSGITAANVSNTPAWSTRMSAQQTSISHLTYTKIQFNTENVDTDSAYDTSNYRFTVPTGKGGNYYVSLCIRLETNDGASSILKQGQLVFYKNGSPYVPYGINSNMTASYVERLGLSVSNVIDLAEGDYLEAYVLGVTSDSANDLAVNSTFSHFSGFKLI